MKFGWRILAVAATALLAGCDQSKPAPQPPPPRPTTVLMVTWLVPGQPPQTTQTDIANMPGCLKAQQAALQAGRDAQAERTRINEANKAEANEHIRAAAAELQSRGLVMAGIAPQDARLLEAIPLPQVSAYCVYK